MIYYIITFIVYVLFVTFVLFKKDVSILKGSIFAILSATFCIVSTIILYMIEQQKFEIGVSYMGSIIFAWILPLIFYKLLDVDFLELLGSIAPAQMIILAITKLNCHFNECCGGIAIDLPSRMFILPIQLIESIVAVILFVVYLMLSLKKSKITYQILLISYGVVRFIEEFGRYHVKEELVFGFLSNGQIVSSFLIIFGLILVFFNKRIDKYTTI